MVLGVALDPDGATGAHRFGRRVRGPGLDSANLLDDGRAAPSLREESERAVGLEAVEHARVGGHREHAAIGHGLRDVALGQRRGEARRQVREGIELSPAFELLLVREHAFERLRRLRRERLDERAIGCGEAPSLGEPKGDRRSDLTSDPKRQRRRRRRRGLHRVGDGVRTERGTRSRPPPIPVCRSGTPPPSASTCRG